MRCERRDDTARRKAGRTHQAHSPTALKGLMGPSEGITKARGSWRLFRGKIPLMPTFHPAYVLRQPTREIKGMVWSDLQQVLKHLGRSPKAGGV